MWNCVFAWDDGSLAWPDHRKGADFLYYEIMQMDAAMGVVSAILELLVSFRNGRIHITDRLPNGWRNVQFSKIRVEGGFCLSGEFRHGRLAELNITSTRRGDLCLFADLGTDWTLNGTPQQSAPSVVHTAAGENFVFLRGQP